MADPLTSSDIIRERMGFGVSPLASEDTRRSYAAAGLSPLGTQDRERIERGGGISPMAGSAEKGAWQMAEYMAGSREQAPVEYGGIGDRPQGSSRRAIRMQDEWDKKQTELLQQQRLSQQMDLEQKQFEMSQRDQQIQENTFYYDRGIKEAEQKLLAQQRNEAKDFISAANSLDPQTPNYRDQLIELRKRYPFGSLDPTVNSIIGEYDKVHSVYMEADKEEQAKEESKIVRLSELTKLAKQTGRNLYDLVASNKDTGELIIDPIAVGEAEADLATKPPVDPNLPVYRREASKLREQVRQLDSKILANQVDARAAKTDRARDEFNQNIAVLTAQRDNLYAEYVGVEELLQEGAGATGEAEIKDTEIPRLTTEDKEAYDALPVGAVFYMNGRRGKKPEVVPQDKTQPAPPAPQTPQPPEDTVKSSQKPFNPKDREELAKLETELQKERERVGLTKQPSGIRQINEAMASQYASVREKAAQLKEAQERLDPFAERDAREAQDIQRALDVVYPSIAGGRFDVGNAEDPRVVSAAEFLTRVNPSLLRMVASAPASNRSGLSLEEIYDIARKAKRSARGRPNKK